MYSYYSLEKNYITTPFFMHTLYETNLLVFKQRLEFNDYISNMKNYKDVTVSCHACY